MGSRRLVAVFVLLACTKPAKKEDPPAPPPALPPAPIEASAPEPIRMEQVEVPGDLRVLVLRGGRAHRYAIVYLHGMCVYPGYYVDSFVNAAAERGDLIAVQGTASCGGDNFLHTWSLDLTELDRRIEAAFVAARTPAPREIVLVGYSQGADRAEALAARYPDKYRRVVLIARSTPPSPVSLRKVHAAALLAGTRDSQANMREGLAALTRAGIPSIFVPMPDAWHGHMGSEPETTMGRALDFVAPVEQTP